MKGLFCAHCKARNNEEYKEVLKKRLVRVRLTCLAGLLVIAGVAVLYFSMVFGALVSEELLCISSLLIGIFLLSYIGFQRYYENKV